MAFWPTQARRRLTKSLAPESPIRLLALSRPPLPASLLQSFGPIRAISSIAAPVTANAFLLVSLSKMPRGSRGAQGSAASTFPVAFPIKANDYTAKWLAGLGHTLLNSLSRDGELILMSVSEIWYRSCLSDVSGDDSTGSIAMLQGKMAVFGVGQRSAIYRPIATAGSGDRRGICFVCPMVSLCPKLRWSSPEAGEGRSAVHPLPTSTPETRSAGCASFLEPVRRQEVEPAPRSAWNIW